MLTILLVVLLFAFFVGGGVGYTRWGVRSMSPAMLVVLVLLVLVLTNRL